MKKIILTSVCAAVMVVSALGQGTANWASIPFTAMTAQTNTTQTSSFGDFFNTGGGAQGATASATSGALFYYALLFNNSGSQMAAPTTVAALNTWQFTGLMATNSTVAGRLTSIAPNTAATVPWGAGVTNSIVMLGWSANMGSTWGAVSNLLNHQDTDLIIGAQFIGTSTTGYIAPGNANPGAIVFGNNPNAFGIPINSLNTQLFLFVPTPEPSILTLVGLGGAVVLALRRRKK